jgi:hypothetical protein
MHPHFRKPSNLGKPLLIGCFLLLLAGIIYAASLVIPTGPADHNAYLGILHLGSEGNTQTITLDALKQSVLIPNKLIAGDSSNTIAESAEFSVIAGGYRNEIGEDADYSVIAAGRGNIINAVNAIIGAGQENIILSRGI